MRHRIHAVSSLRTALAFLAARAQLLALSVALFLSAGAHAQQKSWDISRLSVVFKRAPSEARNWPNPYAGQSAAVRAGAKLFRQHCATCHGEDARGQGSAPTLRSTVLQQTPPGVVFWFLRNGNLRRGMPSWSGLPDQQRWQIVGYLKTLR